jgi:hypothetical protein
VPASLLAFGTKEIQSVLRVACEGYTVFYRLERRPSLSLLVAGSYAPSSHPTDSSDTS